MAEQRGAPIEIEITPLRKSLDVAEFRQLLVDGTMAVRQQCSKHGVLGSGGTLFLLIEPSGHVEPRLLDPGPFAGTPAYSCILDVWRGFSVSPFEGEVQLGNPVAEIYPASSCETPDCSDRRKSLRTEPYRKSKPFTVEKARQLGYDL